MLWIKAFHIVAVVCWFAGLFYLPRLFVYHVQALQQSDIQGVARFEIMERKLYRGIMTPSMVAVVGLGIWMLLLAPRFLEMYWMHIKLLLVVGLVVYHFMCGYYRKQLISRRRYPTERFFRGFNEVPVLFLLVIVVLVVVRPF